jgi:sulfatase modifying factor 1
VDTGAGITMVAVPSGDVTISDRRTQSSWSVEVRAYLLDARPITRTTCLDVAGGPRDSRDQADQRPADSVSWFDAIHFCNALSERDGLDPAYHVRAEAEAVEWDVEADGFRLPTEAEWERACRAGTTGPRYGELDEIAWYRANSGGRTHAVGGKKPNAWGLYDMLGNVWEWCWDIYDPEVYGEYRVLRGGGWFDEHWSCRASVRRRSHPRYQMDDVGFRVARSVAPPVDR